MFSFPALVLVLSSSGLVSAEPFALMFQASSPNGDRASFSADSRLIAVGSYADRTTVDVYDVAARARVQRIAFESNMDVFQLSPDGAHLAVGHGGSSTVWIFSVATGAEEGSVECDGVEGDFGADEHNFLIGWSRDSTTVWWSSEEMSQPCAAPRGSARTRG
jgi:WD40 repeat protein